MEWYFWLCIGWILHWLWNLWHNTEINPENNLEIPSIEMNERKRKIKNGLDMALATNNINEAEYRELIPEYQEDQQIQIVADAEDALCRLGYNKKRIKAVLDMIDLEGMTAEDIIKTALKKL